MCIRDSYLNSAALTDDERAHRLHTYWQPYHDKLREELDRIRAEHGTVLLWEAHSIASVLPRLFEGKLPDLNIGTADGASCAPDILEALAERLPDCGYSTAVNGRFKGGYITRHYGSPADDIHAVQLEMCQSTYMDETYPYGYQANAAAKVIPVVGGMAVSYTHLDVYKRQHHLGAALARHVDMPVGFDLPDLGIGLVERATGAKALGQAGPGAVFVAQQAPGGRGRHRLDRAPDLAARRRLFIHHQHRHCLLYTSRCV